MIAIGKEGDRLKYIHEKYNVRVTVPKDESPITISGKSESMRDAIKELEELVQQDMLKQHVFFPVNILPEDLGVAIGKGGSQSSKVQEEFGSSSTPNARNTLRARWWSRGLWKKPRGPWPTSSSMLPRGAALMRSVPRSSVAERR